MKKATKIITDEKLIPTNNFNRRIIWPNKWFHDKNLETAALPTPRLETDNNQSPDFQWINQITMAMNAQFDEPCDDNNS